MAWSNPKLTCNQKSGQLFFGHFENGRHVFVLEQQIAHALTTFLQGQRPRQDGRDLRSKAAQQVFQSCQETETSQDTVWLNLNRKNSVILLDEVPTSVLSPGVACSLKDKVLGLFRLPYMSCI